MPVVLISRAATPKTSFDFFDYDLMLILIAVTYCACAEADQLRVSAQMPAFRNESARATQPSIPGKFSKKAFRTMRHAFEV